MWPSRKRRIWSRNHLLGCLIIGESSKSISVQSYYGFIQGWKYHLVKDARSVANKIHFTHSIDLVDQSPVLLQQLDNLEPVVSAYYLYFITHGYCYGSLNTGYLFRNITRWRL